MLTNRRDHEIVGIFVSVVLTVGLAAAGALLAGGRGAPDALILAGVLALLLCGFITLTLVAVVRKRVARHGWPRAANGALWASAAVAILNVAFWIVALLAARSRWNPKRTTSTVPAAHGHRATGLTRFWLISRGPREEDGHRRPSHER